MSTQTIAGPDTGFRLTGRKVFVIFLAFFGTIFAADTFLLTSALRTWSGLEERSAYAAGKRYNAEFAIARAQEARGWSLDVQAKRSGPDGASLTVVARDRAGQPLTGLAAHASFERPTDKRLDRGIDLVETGQGTYRATLDGVAGGQWELVIDLMEGGERLHRRRSRLVLP